MFLKSPKEMDKLNVEQIGTSACGPTSVLNVLASLDYSPLPTPENLLKFFPARLRDYKTKSLYKYLYSRAVAGTIHEEIINTIEKISNNSIVGKFFIIKQYENKTKFADWLKECFKNKISLVFTENLFLEGNDAWHHQMGFGIKDDNIYLTNPFQKMPINQMLSYLTAGPWMIIPAEHVRERDITGEGIKELSDERWNCFNVLNRAYNIKKGNTYKFMGNTVYDGLVIPYGGIAGISAFCKKDNNEGMKFLEKYTMNEEDIFLPIYQKNVRANRLNL